MIRVRGPIRVGSFARIGVKLGIVLILIMYFNLLLGEKEKLATTSTAATTTSSTRRPSPSICPLEGKFDQQDPCLIRYVRDEILIRPTSVIRREQRSAGNMEATNEKFNFLKEHLFIPNPNNSSVVVPPGFFVECGAFDGIALSQTLELEMSYNWTGLLIEPSESEFQRLVQSGRNAWMANVALCTTPHSDNVTYYKKYQGSNSLMGGLKHPESDNYYKSWVRCVPLYTILKALKRTTVDYLSLDVEGSELEILKTVPFDKMTFKVMKVEHAHVTGFQKVVVDFLEGKGYRFIGSLIDYFSQDSLFVHHSVYKPGMKLKIKFQPTEPPQPRPVTG